MKHEAFSVTYQMNLIVKIFCFCTQILNFKIRSNKNSQKTVIPSRKQLILLGDVNYKKTLKSNIGFTHIWK